MRDFMKSLGGRLVDAGVSIVPIAPRDKFPAAFGLDGWHPMYGWTKFAKRMPSELELFHLSTAE
jgi:hypothetical protein